MKQLLYMMLLTIIQCGPFSSKQESMNQYQYQIIIQTVSGVDIAIQDNRFTGQHQSIKRLNDALPDTAYQLTEIKSKLGNINQYKQFRLLTNEQPNALIQQLLAVNSLIDGAYQKERAEDPNGQ